MLKLGLHQYHPFPWTNCSQGKNLAIVQCPCLAAFLLKNLPAWHKFLLQHGCQICLLEAKCLPRSCQLQSHTFPRYLNAILDTYARIQQCRGGLDTCAVRFFCSKAILSFVKKVLPNKAEFLSGQDWLWALHSETQEALLDVCLSKNPTWSAAKALGVSPYGDTLILLPCPISSPVFF